MVRYGNINCLLLLSVVLKIHRTAVINLHKLLLLRSIHRHLDILRPRLLVQHLCFHLCLQNLILYHLLIVRIVHNHLVHHVLIDHQLLLLLQYGSLLVCSQEARLILVN